MKIKYFKVTPPDFTQINSELKETKTRFKSDSHLIKFFVRRLNESIKMTRGRKIENAEGKIIGQNWSFSVFKDNFVKVKIPESFEGAISQFANLDEAFDAFIEDAQFNLDVGGLSIEGYCEDISLYGFKIDKLNNFDLLLINHLEKKD